MNRKTKTIAVERKANIRHYKYIAYLSAATGRLLGIRAGCRNWKTFEEAKEHYCGRGKYAPERWLDITVGNNLLSYSERREARDLLSRLEVDVVAAQYKLRKRLRAAKKRKAVRR